MKKFEYLIETSENAPFTNEAILLNKLGKEGWELIAVSYEHAKGIGKMRRIYYFKREKEERN